MTQIALFLFLYSFPFLFSLSLHSICKWRGYWYCMPKAGYKPSKYMPGAESVWCYLGSRQFVFFFFWCLGFSHSVIWAIGFKIWSRSWVCLFIVACLGKPIELSDLKCPCVKNGQDQQDLELPSPVEQIHLMEMRASRVQDQEQVSLEEAFKLGPFITTWSKC